MDYSQLGKEPLRAECKKRGIKYGKMNNEQMRSALQNADSATQKSVSAEKESAPKKVRASGIATPMRHSRLKGLKIEKNREERNGVKRPSAGGKCRAIWDLFDTIKQIDKITLKDVKELAAQEGMNANNVTIEFYQWRKFHAKPTE